MRDFAQLKTFFKDRPELTGTTADYFRSPESSDEVQRIQDDPYELARLTLCLLKHFSLEPSRNSSAPEKTALGIWGDESSKHIFFHLHFQGILNMVGGFKLPRTAPEVALLNTAIQENLDSKLCKAAQMSQRLRAPKKENIRSNRREQLAEEAYDKVINAEIIGRSPLSCEPYPGELIEAARAARDEVYNACYKRAADRMLRVSVQTASQGFFGEYTDCMVAFATRYICPQMAATAN